MTSTIRTLSLLFSIVAVLFLTACGKGKCPTTSLTESGSGGGGGISTGGTVCGAGVNGGGPSAAFVFYLDSVGVETASLSTTGTFTQVTGLTPAAPAGGIIDDMAQVDSKFLYLPFGDIQGVQALSINHSTGGLTSINGSPFLLPGGTADSVLADPKGRFLFVGSEGSGFISVFQIASDGSLTLTSGSPFTSPNLTSADSLAVDGNGKFLYVGQLSSSTPVDVFTIDQTTGALSEVGPFSLGVAQLHADPSGKFLLGVAEVADAPGSATDQHIYVFSIDQTSGVPTPVTGSPFATAGAPFDFIIHPNGKFVYVTGNAAGGGSLTPIEGFQLDTTSGALTAISGSPFSGLLGALCKMDPNGGSLFCDPDDAGAGFTVFSVNSTTGALTNTVTPLVVSDLAFAWTVTN
jgi:6-phosphogluconolactonase (cycloisomerase 2 family)